MADETKKTETTETTTVKKGGLLGNILTSIVCLLIGAGAMFGIDLARVQETIDKTKANELAEIIATETVTDTIANEGFVNIAITDAKKEELTKSAIEKAKAAVEKFFAAAKEKDVKTAAEAGKEVVEAGKEVVEEVKEKVEGAVEAPAADAATVTENAVVTDVKKD